MSWITAVNKPHWTVLSGADTIEPVVGCDKVATWVPHNGAVELLERINYIAAKPIFVR